MSSPLEFLATLNGSLVSPLESLLFPIIGGLVIITALWALTMGPLRGRPDLIAPALFRSFAIAGLIFASPYVGTLLLSGWSIAYSTGYNAAKQSLDDILERGNTYFSTMGLIAGGVGAQAVKVAALKVEQAAREAAIKRITAEVYEEVNTQAAKQGWSSTKIGQELHERLLRRLTPEEIEAATQKELASGKSLGNRMDKALNYANWVGIPLMGMLWLFYVLGLATGLTVILLKLAWPIALAMLALSPRSGSFFMARWFNMAISALATALLVPMIVGLAAQIFIGVPVEEVINRWKELADTYGGRRLPRMAEGRLFPGRNKPVERPSDPGRLVHALYRGGHRRNCGAHRHRPGTCFDGPFRNRVGWAGGRRVAACGSRRHGAIGSANGGPDPTATPVRTAWWWDVRGRRWKHPASGRSVAPRQYASGATPGRRAPCFNNRAKAHQPRARGFGNGRHA